jgi:RNA polymerase sigma-70 factor (ECF subfamily)
MVGMNGGENLSDDLARETALLRRIARGIVLEPALAEDAVQEAWLAALRAGPHALANGGWLTQAVKRIALGLRRREARQARREREGARREQLPPASETAARVELLRELLGALESLDEPYRTAVQLRLVDDLPPREIAERTGVPVETARTRIKRGVERLRAQIDARHAGRRGEFLALLAPLAGFEPFELGIGAALGGKAIVGGTLMGMKAQVGAAAALAFVAALFVWSPWSPTAQEVERREAVSFSATPAEESAGAASASAGTQVTAAVDEAPSRDEALRTSVSSAPNATWIVRGRALERARQGVANLEVRVQVLSGYEGEGEVLLDAKARTDASGAFSTALPPPSGAALVKANVQSEFHYSGVEQALVLAGAQAPELLLNCLPLDLVLRGRVVDSQARALEGASLRAIGSQAVSDAEGRFELRASSLIDATRLTVFLTSYAPREINVQTLGARERLDNIEIVLQRGGVVRGRVVDENGRGVADARIETFATEELAALSGADGRFELTSLPLDASSISLSVRAEGFVRALVHFEDGRLPNEEYEVRLEPEFEVTGTVTDESGAPLLGVAIGLGRNQFDAEVARAVSGDAGRFTLRGASARKARLFANHEGFAAYDVEFEPALQRGPVVITLRKGGSLRGVTVDENGQPLARIHVSLRNDEGYYLESRATSDATGRFELANVPDQAGLSLECYGAGRVRTTVRVSRGAKEVKVVLPPDAGLCGRVIDAASGAPIERFRVRFVDPEVRPGDEYLNGVNTNWFDTGREFRSREGRWSFGRSEQPAGAVTGIEITAAGYAPARVARAVLTLDPQSSPIETPLHPPASLRGRVLALEFDAPVADARLRIVPVRGPKHRQVDENAPRTLSDMQGAFEFTELSGEPVWIVVEAQGFARKCAGPFEPTPASPPVQIDLERGAVLRGVLLEWGGAPIGQAEIELNRTDALSGERLDWRLTTDAQGRFEFAQLGPGEYQVARLLRSDSLGIFDLARQVDVQENALVEIELRPRGTVRVSGRVNAGATPFSGPIHASKLGDGAEESRAIFARDGQFKLEGLSAGRWQFSAREHLTDGRPERHGSLEMELADGASAVVAIDVAGN